MKNDKWELVEAFFDEHSLVDHHIDSYNDFVNRRLQKIIDEVEIPELGEGEYEIEIGELKIEKPYITEADGSKSKIYPMEARLRNLTYAAHLFLEMGLSKSGKRPSFEEVYIGELPAMLKSDICHLNGLSKKELIEVGEDPNDPGGYFIINGSERVLVSIEEIAPNKVIIEKDEEKERVKSVVTSVRKGFRSRLTLEYKKPRKTGVYLRVSFPYVPGEIPLVVLLRALGLATDEEIITNISEDFNYQIIVADDLQIVEDSLRLDKEKLNKASEEENRKYLIESALRYIGNRVAGGMAEEYRISRAEDVIDNYLLPHIGVKPEDRIKKAIYLCEMAEMTLQVVFGEREPHDKDHYANKRLKTSGDLMEDLFRVAFTGLIRDMAYQIERNLTRRKKPSIRQAVRPDVLTENIKHAIATGNWVGGRVGVSQLLDRTNHIASLSHLRRVVSPLSRSQPHFEARDLHATQFGRICPIETPEGPNCGLVKNLALMARISEGTDAKEVEKIIKSSKLVEEI